MKEYDTYASLSCADDNIGRQGPDFIKGQKRIDQIAQREKSAVLPINFDNKIYQTNTYSLYGMAK